mmetsp:Transcript_25579/g.35164  ORF Transcript_25579/g.35164 Transcript_25579/m.35164 type:complete len:87 (+) Transcript_25579:62-322(+)
MYERGGGRQRVVAIVLLLALCFGTMWMIVPPKPYYPTPPPTRIFPENMSGKLLQSNSTAYSRDNGFPSLSPVPAISKSVKSLRGEE